MENGQMYTQEVGVKMILDDYIEDIRNLIYGDSVTMPTYIAIGTGTTAATGADTILETEVGRKSLSKSKSGDDTIAYESTWNITEGNGNTITEVGAINAASSGTLANRQVFPGFSKTDDYELRVQIYIKSENN